MITFLKWLRFKITGKPYRNLGSVEGISPRVLENMKKWIR
jgi:hypothetical protein